jgi:hypothetical protein
VDDLRADERRWRRRYSGLCVAILAVRYRHPPPPPTGTFTVSGGYLIDPTGAKMIPEGTGVWDYNASDQIGSLTILQNNTGYPLKNVMPKANYIRVMVFPTNHSSTSFTFPPTDPSQWHWVGRIFVLEPERHYYFQPG